MYALTEDLKLLNRMLKVKALEMGPKVGTGKSRYGRLQSAPWILREFRYTWNQEKHRIQAG